MATAEGAPRSVREIVAALKTPVPNAADVSAVVAQHWHLGLAEDAERRSKGWRQAVQITTILGRPNERAAKIADYFEALAQEHEAAAGAADPPPVIYV